MREIAGQAGLAQEAALTAARELLEELARRAGDLANLAGTPGQAELPTGERE